jgi:hypothetical protein
MTALWTVTTVLTFVTFVQESRLRYTLQRGRRERRSLEITYVLFLSRSQVNFDLDQSVLFRSSNFSMKKSSSENAVNNN